MILSPFLPLCIFNFSTSRIVKRMQLNLDVGRLMESREFHVPKRALEFRDPKPYLPCFHRSKIWMSCCLCGKGQ